MQPTLVDAFIVAAFVGSVLSACHRGLGREMLHTFLFAIAVGAGILFFRDMDTPKSQPELAKLLISCSFYLAVMYVLMWGIMKFVSPLIMGHQMVGMRSRFWAGALSVAKLVGCALALNLWFAIHSPNAHPLRLQALPQVVRESLLVQLSDRKTDDLYRWLARENILDYNKFVDKPATPEADDAQSVDGILGITAPGGEPVNSDSRPELTPESYD